MELNLDTYISGVKDTIYCTTVILSSNYPAVVSRSCMPHFYIWPTLDLVPSSMQLLIRFQSVRSRPTGHTVHQSELYSSYCRLSCGHRGKCTYFKIFIEHRVRCGSSLWTLRNILRNVQLATRMFCTMYISIGPPGGGGVLCNLLPSCCTRNVLTATR
jgi:hypothetical protein